MSGSPSSGQQSQGSRKRPSEGGGQPNSKHQRQDPKSASDAISLLKSCTNSLVRSSDLNDEFSCYNRPLMFADSGPLESFPNQPLITISGFGIMPLPVTGVIFQELAKHFNLDQRSNSISIDVSKVSFGDTSFENMVKNLVEKHIFPKVGCFSFLRQGCVLNGLTIQGPHSDTKVHRLLYSDDGARDYTCINGDMYKFGTLSIQLPSVYSGGKIKVEHIEKCSLSFDPSLYPQACYYYSCMGPVEVSQALIATGYKVTLEYTLFAPGGIDERLHPAIRQKISIGRYLKYLTENDNSVFWPLEGNCKGKVNSIWKFSHPTDKHLVDSILEGTLYADCSQVEIYLASLRKTIFEKGDCLDIGALRVSQMFDQETPSKENCFEADRDLSIEITYEVCDFKPLTQNTPNAKSLSITDEINIEYVERFAAIKDWGSVVNVGCSGYTYKNYPKAKYESYHQKDVIVVMSTSRSFSYKLNHSIESAIEFLEGVNVSLVREDQLREMEKSVIVKLRNKVSRSSCEIKYRMISVCIKNKSWLSCLDMLRICSRKNNAGIPIKEDMQFAYKIIAKVVDTFGWEKAEKPVMLLFKKCHAYQCKEVIKCVDLIPQVDKEQVFDFLIEKITVNSSNFNNFDWFFDHIFRFGVSSTQSIPESVWDNLTDCQDFIDRTNLICCLKKYGDNVGDRILSICYNEIDSDYDTWDWLFDRGDPGEGFTAKVLEYCIENDKTDMISKFANLAEEFWEWEGEFCHLVAFVMRMFTDQYSMDRLDQSLINLLQQRMNVLKVSIDGGEPPFTWAQPKVILHKDDSYGLVEFLHSPEESYTFYVPPLAEFMKTFGNESQYEETGYYSVKVEGFRVQVTKKKTAWERDVEIYKNKVTEYDKIVKFVEESGIVFPSIN